MILRSACPFRRSQQFCFDTEGQSKPLRKSVLQFLHKQFKGWHLFSLGCLLSVTVSPLWVAVSLLSRWVTNQACEIKVMAQIRRIHFLPWEQVIFILCLRSWGKKKSSLEWGKKIYSLKLEEQSDGKHGFIPCSCVSIQWVDSGKQKSECLLLPWTRMPLFSFLNERGFHPPEIPHGLAQAICIIAALSQP